jgi:hypothetical protein
MIAAALLLACATSARADGPVQLNAGVTRSSLFDASGWSGGLGYRFGASVRLPLFAGVWFEPETAWARRTTVATSAVDGGALKSRMALQYLEAPMLVKRIFFRQRRLAPIVLGGLYYAANLTASVHTEVGGHAFDENARSEVKRHDAGWIAGGGVEFQKAQRTWTVEVRYLAGFGSINRMVTSDRWRTRSLTTTVGMKW